ncbi:MAG: Rpn family recombination-promoting nuclease/putative transposase [Treponema sp.]|nr:Rpn family recombination-promoting nuclease/putative transposase [Treponema sp.]
MSKTVFDNIDPVVLARVRAMRLLDDEFMSAAFSGDIKTTQLLIRILLNRNDLTVTKSMTQVQKTNLFGKSVKLDVVAEDIFKTEYNIEIQRADSGASARRIRYHQAMLDNHTLNKGGTFKDLPNLYIIFILEHDIFERGLPVYRVYKTLNIQDDLGNNLPFDDDCNIMYINGEYKGDDPLGKLMHDFSTSNADEMFYKELADRMRFLKQDEEGIEMASKIVEEYGDIRAAEALQQGIKQGAQQKAVETAKNLKTNGIDINIIAECTGLSIEEVQKL